MTRLIYAALAIGALTTPAFAAIDCNNEYKSFWDKFNNGPAKELTGQQLAIVGRQALRAFDGCNAGDENTTRSIFQRLNEAAPAKDQSYWTSLQESAPVKK